MLHRKATRVVARDQLAVGHSFPKPVGQSLNLTGVGGRSGDEELVSADPGDDVRLTGIGAKCLSGQANRFVTDLVSVAVVDGFQVVEVDEEHHHGAFVATCPGEFAVASPRGRPAG